MRKLAPFGLFCCISLIGLMGCSGQPTDPTLVMNRNIMLIPSTAPGYRAEPQAPLTVVCGKPDPRNPQMEVGWGGETSPRCWYGRPVSAIAPTTSPPASAPGMNNQQIIGVNDLAPSTQSSAPFVSVSESSPAMLQFASITPPLGARMTHTQWLIMINSWRSTAHLPPVAEDPALSEGDRKHVQYLMAAYGSLIRARQNLGAKMHTEDPHNSLYTQESLAAAQKSDVAEAMTPSGTLPPWWAIKEWTAGPFHRAPILDPFLSGVGYDESCYNQVCLAALDVESDTSLKAGTYFRSPIVFPPDHAVINIRSFDAEWPNPLTSCPGYRAPAGFPITFQTGSWITPKLDSFSVTVNGALVEACGFDPESYRNPEPALEKRGRLVLKDYGMVVVIPREPLADGIYTVKTAIDGHQYVTSFTVNPDAGRSDAAAVQPQTHVFGLIK